jgi:endonuclease/exonuclease/phosphatase family metal-dependent hydrolase
MHQQRRKMNVLKIAFMRSWKLCPKNDIKILLGDVNDKVGLKDQDRSVVGNCEQHEESNDNGLRLTGFTSALNMIIESTTFPYKKIHLATWRSSDGTTNYQIDHILMDARHKNNIMDVRTYRVANADSDHYLVIIRIRAKISRSKYVLNKEKTIRYNISNLKQRPGKNMSKRLRIYVGR